MMMNHSPFRDHAAKAIVAVAVVLAHIAFVYEILLWAPAEPVSPPVVAKTITLRLIRPTRPKIRMPPAMFTAFAAPIAPYIPPPHIRVEAPRLRVASLTPTKRNETTGYARIAGTGGDVRGGEKIPPSPPVFLAKDSPGYPAADRRNGSWAFVSAACIVEPDGRTDGCNIIHVMGRPEFGTAVLDWLQNGKARYRPATRDGQPVAQSAALKFYFVPTGVGVQQ